MTVEFLKELDSIVKPVFSLLLRDRKRVWYRVYIDLVESGVSIKFLYRDLKGAFGIEEFLEEMVDGVTVRSENEYLTKVYKGRIESSIPSILDSLNSVEYEFEGVIINIGSTILESSIIEESGKLILYVASDMNVEALIPSEYGGRRKVVRGGYLESLGG